MDVSLLQPRIPIFQPKSCNSSVTLASCPSFRSHSILFQREFSLQSPTNGAPSNSLRTFCRIRRLRNYSIKSNRASFFPQHERKISSIVKCAVVNASIAPQDDALEAKFRGMLFYIVTSIAALTLIVPMLLQHPLVLLFDKYRRKAHHFIAKQWAKVTMFPFMKIEIVGLENLPPPNDPAVYVSNHQSFLDIYALLTLGISFKFISKMSIFRYPVIGWAMQMMGVVPLRRMDGRSQMECIRNCIDLVKNGASVFFFPEGTRSKDGKLGEFKKGAFRIASKTGVKLVPMVVIGTGNMMPSGKENVVNNGIIKIVVLKPIVEDDAELLCNETRRMINDALQEHSCLVQT